MKTYEWKDVPISVVGIAVAWAWAVASWFYEPQWAWQTAKPIGAFLALTLLVPVLQVFLGRADSMLLSAVRIALVCIPLGFASGAINNHLGAEHPDCGPGPFIC